MTLGVDNIGRDVAMTLTRAEVDKKGVFISSSEDCGDTVAIEFSAKKSIGKCKYIWLYRVKFAVPSTFLATKVDSITFSTPTIEGTVMRRNKLDGQDKHPWEAEVDEGDTGVDAATITAWYIKVYEPHFAIVGN